MAGTISLKKVIFLSEVALTTAAVGSMDVALETWESLGERSVALQAYAEDFLQLERVIKKYHDMLFNDVQAIKSVGMELKATDERLQNVWEFER